MKVNVFKISQNCPNDLTALEALIEAGKLDPAKIVAILGKTEGNGCVNDFTRGFAVQTLQSYLQAKTDTETAAKIVYVMSGGTEGVLSPHLTVFTRQDSAPDESRRWGLVLGVNHTRDFLPDEIGTLAMVEAVADGVKAAIADAGLATQDVHFIQIKCPLVASDGSNASHEVAQIKTQDSYESMAYSRGASALGAAIALGEVNWDQLTADGICRNYAVYSNVASASAGIELQNCEILVLGNAADSTSSFIIGHSVMQHALDAEAVRAAIASTGQPSERVVNLFAKAEADPTGLILGRRHTMLNDSDINHTRMARAVVGAVVASVVRDPMIYVSGGSEHQGPPGGGAIAAIAAIPDSQ